MTCIVGVVHKREVWIGGDSAGVGGYALVVRADTKVFRNGPFVMGFTTSFRMGQLLRHALHPPEHPLEMDLEKFMCTRFVDAVRECLKSGGYAKKQNEVEEGGAFLVGYRERLFRIDSDYQVGEASDRYDAVGCGAEVALGSLYATKHLNPRLRVSTALKAAERFSAGVRGPFAVLRQKPPGAAGDR